MIPLFEVYPQLEALIPHSPLASLPTPVHKLANIGFDNAWIKRDDLTRSDYGGNKIRKLEFIIAEIKRLKKTHVITFGAIGTNAGVATALLCAKYNLRCTIYLFDQPVTDTVKQNLSLMDYYGAELKYKGSLLNTALAFYLSPGRLSPQNYYLFAGCSNPVATFAYVNAAFELKQQIDSGICPNPAAIHVAVGSSSTLAGLTLGAQLAGLDTQVIGTRVAPSHVGVIPSCTPPLINKMIKRCHDTIESLNGTQTDSPECILLDDQYGFGYGHTTTAAQQSILMMNDKEKIPLEGTYSGKAFASFYQHLQKTQKPLLFWNTFNSQDTTSLKDHTLPKKLQDLLDD